MCWKCLQPVEIPMPVSRTATCPVCGTDVHCCKNCRFYAPGAHCDCHETVDEPVYDKERANFCDAFSLQTEFSGSGTNSFRNSVADARKLFNDLFSV